MRQGHIALKFEHCGGWEDITWTGGVIVARESKSEQAVY